MPSEPLIALALSLLISLAPFLPAAEKSAPEEDPAPAVEEQPALSAEQFAALALLKAAEVTVARHLLERDAGIQAVQRLRVAPAVAEVNDGVERRGTLPLHGADHVVLIAMGVGKKKNFHSSAAAP